jgi:DNA topoisomerase-1
MTKLVIVESPAKARKIGGYLGDDYVVEASVGHIRDLPQRAADIPAEYKKIAWAKEGVNIEEDFAPLYVINPDKKKKVAELKALMKDADELILATDEDREGEAIAWHLIEVLRPKIPVRRMVFHEITEDAIKEAAVNTRDLDYRLVDAQETRRVLDRLFGYRLSPVLWKKVMPRISAGRVQSVATRLIVERERERMAFISSSWWDVKAATDKNFTARLISLDGKKVATTNDFDDKGQFKVKSNKDEILLLDEKLARDLTEQLTGEQLTVISTEESPRTERPKAPFTTSTMQQDAGSRLGWGAQITMRIAQRLYENGYITYMRTDSVSLSAGAIAGARASAQALYGKEYVPDSPRFYEGKSKNAQEAHEAIRPAGDTFKTPGELAPELSRDEFALYDLIWKRTIASQMSDAKKMQARVDFEAKTLDEKVATFRANGSIITFPGFLAAYEDIETEDAKRDEDEAKTKLPPMAKGEKINVTDFSCEGHDTKPPARYTEPTLVKKLEELGIGRPSTFASIIQTIQDRGYVTKRGRALVPTFLAFSVTGLLEQHFGKLVDYEFTASMEEDLDKIANGTQERVAWLTDFFYGHDDVPGLEFLAQDLGNIDAQQINTMKLSDDIEIRVGRFGAYVQQGVGDERKFANIPENIAPDEMTLALAIELLAKPSGERELGIDPNTTLPIIAKSGRYGPYVTEVFPEPEMVVDKKTGELKKPRKKKDAPKPKTASLLSTMDLDTITFDDALRLLSLPRIIGQYEGVDISVQNGRYGPYMTHGADSRTLTSEDQIFTVTLEEAIDIYKQPKVRRGRGAPKPPLKELGADPATGRNLIIKDGRFGMYITDGETNATLRRGDTVEFMTIERGLELLAGRRAWEAENGGTSKKKVKKAAASKSASKTTVIKKAASKKKTVKKSGKSSVKTA